MNIKENDSAVRVGQVAHGACFYSLGNYYIKTDLHGDGVNLETGRVKAFTNDDMVIVQKDAEVVFA